MHYLRIITIIVFLGACALLGWTLYSLSLQDKVAPEITDSVGQLHLQVSADPGALMQGLTATDDRDGDLTDRILVERISRFSQPGQCQVSYVVFDSSNNFCRYQREVVYDDYISPRLQLDQPLMYPMGEAITITDRVRLYDCLDGDISDRVRIISNMVNNYAEGVYPVILEVSNSCGDTSQLNLWVHYTRTDYNVSIQLHKYVVYHPQGEEFDPYQYIASIADSDLNPLDPTQVQIQGTLDVEKPGIYQLVYSYAEGKLAGKSAITVVITERQA